MFLFLLTNHRVYYLAKPRQTRITFDTVENRSKYSLQSMHHSFLLLFHRYGYVDVSQEEKTHQPSLHHKVIDALQKMSAPSDFHSADISQHTTTTPSGILRSYSSRKTARIHIRSRQVVQIPLILRAGLFKAGLS